MADPIVTTLIRLNKMLDESAHGLYTGAKAQPFEHGAQVGRCWGLQDAINVFQNVLSADEIADSKL